MAVGGGGREVLTAFLGEEDGAVGFGFAGGEDVGEFGEELGGVVRGGFGVEWQGGGHIDVPRHVLIVPSWAGLCWRVRWCC